MDRTTLRASCRAAPLALLVLTSLLFAPTAAAGPGAACTLNDPLSCCEMLGLVCNVDCGAQVLEPACCILQGNDPLSCCPPTTLNCKCPPTSPDLCCFLNAASLKECLCDPLQPATCCAVLGLRCCLVTPIPTVDCCLQQDPFNPDCLPPCEPHVGAALPRCDTSPCVADGILVTEQDALGGTSRNAYAESRINTFNAAPGPYTPPPGPSPSAPPTPQVHADAKLFGVQYSNPNLGIDLDAKVVFSRCDLTVADTGNGVFGDTYGRGGIEDLHLTVLGQTIDLTALSYELQAFGGPGGANAAWHCDLASLGLNTPHPSAVTALCDLPIAPINVGPVTVWYNELNGPTHDPATGLTYYQGSHLHIQVAAGLAVVDIYIGYVQVAVPSAPAPLFPATYLPHGPCLLVCT